VFLTNKYFITTQQHISKFSKLFIAVSGQEVLLWKFIQNFRSIFPHPLRFLISQTLRPSHLYAAGFFMIFFYLRSSPMKRPFFVMVLLSLLVFSANVWSPGASARVGDDLREHQLGNLTSDSLNVELVNQIGGPVYGVAVQGNYAYVGVGPRLLILDISGSELLKVGQTQPLPAIVQGVTVAGNYAYLALGSAGLQVVNISNNANPVPVGICNTPGFAHSLAMAGIYAYVADGSGGLRVINISNPAAPSEVGSLSSIGQVNDLAVQGDYAYLANDTTGLRIVNISTPTNPT
jgi:hypothetical protein